MKKLLVLLAVVIAAGLIGCTDTNKPPSGTPSGEDAFTVISFHANGGTGSMNDQTILAGTTVRLRQNTFTRDGYTFAGWATSDIAVTAVYTDRQNYTAAEGESYTVEVTLFAVWTLNSPDNGSVISFDANGGTGGQTATVTALSGEAMPALSAAAPTNEGNTGTYPNDYYQQYYCGTTKPGTAFSWLVTYTDINDKFFEKKYFNGYWDAESNGKQYYKADLSSAAEWDKTGTATLYAQWLTPEQKYEFTLATDDFIAYFTETAPEIDGVGTDSVWANVKWQPIKYQWMHSTNPNITQISNAADFSGRFKALWTASKLYILAEITDDTYSENNANPTTYPENNDCLELFVDENASGGARSNSVPSNFFTYHLHYLGSGAADYRTGTSDTGYIDRASHVNFKYLRNGNPRYWEVELKLYGDQYPSSNNPPADGTNVATTPLVLTEGKKIGIAVAYCDSDSSTRNHMFGSMAVTGADDNARNTGYQNAGNASATNQNFYGKLYLVK